MSLDFASTSFCEINGDDIEDSVSNKNHMGDCMQTKIAAYKEV